MKKRTKFEVLWNANKKRYEQVSLILTSSDGTEHQFMFSEKTALRIAIALIEAAYEYATKTGNKP